MTAVSSVRVHSGPHNWGSSRESLTQTTPFAPPPRKGSSGWVPKSRGPTWRVRGPHGWGQHQMRIVNAVLSGCLTTAPCRLHRASDSPESIWSSWCTQHPLESTSVPAIRGRSLRHRTLQPSTSWAENPTLRKATQVPLQPSNCCLLK